MLNIRLYSGVPFQRSYNNVIKFNNQSELNSYLETYLQGTINNIAQFFDGNNEIVLSDLYENCNYMFINDTNSATPNKYYFIENYEFISGGGVKYHLILDIWATYNYNIVLKPSLCVRGHCDILNIPEYKVNNNNLKSNRILLETDNNSITNLLIPAYNKRYSEGTLIVIANVSQTGGGYTGIDILYKTLFLNDEPTEEAFKIKCIDTFNSLNSNHFKSIDTQLDYDFEIIKAYFIPSINLTNRLYTLIHTDTEYHHAIFGDNSIVVGSMTGFVRMNLTANLYDSDNQYITTVRFNNFNVVNLTNNSIYKSNLTRKDYEGKRVLIGTLDNYREIDATGLTNNSIMSLNLYFLQMKQIEIMLEYNNVKINLTSSFEIPFLNDEYLLYLNQNQNQINVANKQNALNLGLSLASISAGLLLAPATAGGSMALAMGAIGITGAVSKAMTTEAMRNAQLNDMQNKFDKLDGINNNCLIMVIKGVGAFTVDDNDEFTIKQYERFGNETQYYIDNIYPSDLTRYNYVYVKFENVSLTGNFNENIRNIFETIFNKGVRIWFNASQFLNSMTHESS